MAHKVVSCICLVTLWISCCTSNDCRQQGCWAGEGAKAVVWQTSLQDQCGAWRGHCGTVWSPEGIMTRRCGGCGRDGIYHVEGGGGDRIMWEGKTGWDHAGGGKGTGEHCEVSFSMLLKFDVQMMNWHCCYTIWTIMGSEVTTFLNCIVICTLCIAIVQSKCSRGSEAVAGTTWDGAWEWG